MLSHGVDKWYKMQCGSGIPGIRLGMEKHFVVEELQTRMMKEDLPDAHEMEAFMEVAQQGNVLDLLACDWASNEDSMRKRTQKKDAIDRRDLVTKQKP